MSCKKCDQLMELYERTPKLPRDYWLMTELFVMLHGGDVCKDARMKTKDELYEELRPLLTDEFLSTLVLAAKTIGWDVDHTETVQFVKECVWTVAGNTTDPLPDTEPFDYAETKEADEKEPMMPPD